MILPIDRKINDRIPFANYALIGVNSLILVLVSLVADNSEHLTALYQTYGYVPDHVRPHAFVTHMFMHGGGIHLVGNMVFLGFFGLNVERRLGPLTFLVLYFVSGLTSLGLFLSMGPEGETPLVGASGAISGVTGMYLALYRTRLVTVFSVAGPFQARAVVFVLFWAGMEVFNAVVMGKEVMVAHWAHVGGFAGGFLTVFFLLRTGFKGYPEAPQSDLKDLAATFTQLRYIPVQKNIRATPDSTFALYARREENPPPEARKFLPDNSAPHLVVGELEFTRAEDLQSVLSEMDYPCTIFPQKSRVLLPVLDIATALIINGRFGWESEGGFPVSCDPDFVYLIEADRIADTVFLDLFLTSPWTNVRISEKISNRPLLEVAIDLRRYLPQANLGPGFLDFSENHPDRIPAFRTQHDMDRHHLWILQGKTLRKTD